MSAIETYQKQHAQVKDKLNQLAGQIKENSFFLSSRFAARGVSDLLALNEEMPYYTKLEQDNQEIKLDELVDDHKLFDVKGPKTYLVSALVSPAKTELVKEQLTKLSTNIVLYDNMSGFTAHLLTYQGTNANVLCLILTNNQAAQIIYPGTDLMQQIHLFLATTGWIGLKMPERVKLIERNLPQLKALWDLQYTLNMKQPLQYCQKQLIDLDHDTKTIAALKAELKTAITNAQKAHQEKFIFKDQASINDFVTRLADKRASIEPGLIVADLAWLFEIKQKVNELTKIKINKKQLTQNTALKEIATYLQQTITDS